MIINQTDRCIFARFFQPELSHFCGYRSIQVQDRSVVKLDMTREFDSRIVGSIPAAPLKPASLYRGVSQW
jgi:hypothetical protein